MSPRTGSKGVRGVCLVVGLALSGAAGVTAGTPRDAFAQEEVKEEKRKSVDADAVYFGDARSWAKPAEVDMDAVFREISEYKEIVQQKLDSKDARYGVLLSKARQRFRDAVRAAAKDGSYDLVARIGSVKGVDSVPVITQDVIKKL